ncbi:hypothetical protein Tco_1330307 [Tanacetum coccineum]
MHFCGAQQVPSLLLKSWMFEEKSLLDKGAKVPQAALLGNFWDIQHSLMHLVVEDDGSLYGRLLGLWEFLSKTAYRLTHASRFLRNGLRLLKPQSDVMEINSSTTVKKLGVFSVMPAFNLRFILGISQNFPDHVPSP